MSRKCFPAICMMFLLILLTGAAKQYAESVKDAFPTVSLRLSSPLTADDYLHIQDSFQEGFPDVVRFAAWTQKEGIITNSSGDRGASTRIILFSGGDEIVWPQRFLNLGTRDNLQGRGCSVSTQLAYELFGSTHAAGLPFEFEDTVYSVQGVFEFSDPLLMIPVSPENDFLFDNLELFIRPGKEGGTIAQAFLRENGLDADAVVNGPELGAVLCLMSNLPVFFLWVSVFIALLWKLLKKQAQIQYQLETASFLLLSLFLLFGTHTKIPASLIPTKWSDFSYWGRTALLYKERLMDLLSLNVTAKDLFFRMEFLALLVFLMLGMAVAGADMVSLAAWGNQFTIRDTLFLHAAWVVIMCFVIRWFPVPPRFLYCSCFPYLAFPVLNRNQNKMKLLRLEVNRPNGAISKKIL